MSIQAFDICEHNRSFLLHLLLMAELGYRAFPRFSCHPISLMFPRITQLCGHTYSRGNAVGSAVISQGIWHRLPIESVLLCGTLLSLQSSQKLGYYQYGTVLHSVAKMASSGHTIEACRASYTKSAASSALIRRLRCFTHSPLSSSRAYLWGADLLLLCVRIPFYHISAFILRVLFYNSGSQRLQSRHHSLRIIGGFSFIAFIHTSTRVSITPSYRQSYNHLLRSFGHLIHTAALLLPFDEFTFISHFSSLSASMYCTNYSLLLLIFARVSLRN